MTATTSSTIEQLSRDLRESFISVTYWEMAAPRRKVVQYNGFVSGCAFSGVEGISTPRLVIRRWKDGVPDKDDLDVRLENILAIEISRDPNPPVSQRPDNDDGCPPWIPESDQPLAWWYAPFGGELRRFLL